MQKTRRGTGTDMCKIQDRLAAALAACGYEVVAPDAPLRVHSHCAGMDAVSWSIKKLGISAQVLVTESDPAAATFHMMHHSSKIDHIITDIKWVAEGSAGPCFKHGGKMCTWETQCDLVFSSFVCKPYSPLNNKRIKTMDADVGSDPNGVDTYHHTKTIIARYKPRAFVLENVSGVAAPLSGDDPGTTPRGRKRPSPADFMLDDLRGAGYEVAMLPSVKASEVAKMCQSRPRALFFGVRRGESVDVASATRLFKKLGIEYAALREIDKIDDFLDASAWGAVDTRAVDPGAAKSEDAETEYISEYAAVRKILRAANPDCEELGLPPAPGEDRPSDSVPAESPKMRAKVDAAARFNLKKMHTPTCPKTLGCSCHPLADVSQRVDRVNWRVDGSIPTLTTRSRVFSYKLRRFLAPSELALAMGYSPRCSLVPFSSTVAAALVGNGYCVPVCALAVAAAASVVGSVRPKTSKAGLSTAPRPS